MSKLFWLANSFWWLSLKETTSIIRLNIKIKLKKKKEMSSYIWLVKINIKIKKIDLKNTWNLKTAIIENEWINNLNKDIFEGPKYLDPLVELISEIYSFSSKNKS